MNALDALNLGRSHGITSAAMHPLLALMQEHPITPADLANRIGTTTSNMTGLLDRLEKAGWIIRHHSKFDRRQIHIVPTERAFETLADLLPK